MAENERKFIIEFPFDGTVSLRKIRSKSGLETSGWKGPANFISG